MYRIVQMDRYIERKEEKWIDRSVLKEIWQKITSRSQFPCVLAGFGGSPLQLLTFFMWGRRFDIVWIYLDMLGWCFMVFHGNFSL